MPIVIPADYELISDELIKYQMFAAWEASNQAAFEALGAIFFERHPELVKDPPNEPV